jgi:hypothetical protein
MGAGASVPISTGSTKGDTDGNETGAGVWDTTQSRGVRRWLGKRMSSDDRNFITRVIPNILINRAVRQFGPDLLPELAAADEIGMLWPVSFVVSNSLVLSALEVLRGLDEAAFMLAGWEAELHEDMIQFGLNGEFY